MSVLFTRIPTQDLIYLQKKGVAGNRDSISTVVAKPYRPQTNILKVSQ
jgi:hypothetical protein